MSTQSAFRRCLAIVFSTACLFTISAQPNTTAVYGGVWKGQCKGRTFVVLTLNHDRGESLKGTIAVGGVRVGDDGEVEEVTGEANDPAPISDTTAKEDELTFKAKADNDVIGYRFRLIGANKAKLQIEGAPPNIKPFTLERVPAEH